MTTEMLKPRIKENGLQKMPSAFQIEWNVTVSENLPLPYFIKIYSFGKI